MLKNKILLTALFISVLAFAMRLPSLSREIMVDEPTWLDRSYSFWVNLSKGKLEGTLQSGHPGVPTMVLAGSGMSIQRFATKEPYSRDIMLKYIFSARLPIVIAISLFLGLIFYYAVMIFNYKTALISGLVMAIEPFFVNFTRLVHIDGLLTVFMLSSIMTALIFAKNRDKKFLIYSSFFASLSFLSKSPSILLVPAVFASIYLSKKDKINNIFRTFISWGLRSAVFTILLWPVLWVKPVLAFNTIFRGASVAVGNAHATNVYIFEPWYYIQKTYFHSSPITLLLLTAGFIYGGFIFIKLRKRIFTKSLLSLWVLLGYSCLFAIVFTISAKRGERYILPALSSLVVVSAYALTRIFEKIKSRSLYYLVTFSAIILLILEAGRFLSLNPYFLSYYNPVISTPHQAKLGFGEGLREAAEYLNSKNMPEQLVVASWYPDIFGADFNGKTIELGNYEKEEVEYVVLYKGMMGRSEFDNATRILRSFENKNPEKTVYINGMEYVWIYKK